MRDLMFRRVAAKKGNRIRKQRNWKIIIRRCLVGAGALLGLAVIGAAGFFGASRLREADFFRLERVTVEDNRRVSEAEVLAVGEVKAGMSLFEIEPRQIGLRIETLDWVKTALVERIFPRELRIRLEERVPVAVVKLDHFYYADREGTLFKLLVAGDRLDFPIITGIDRDSFLNDPERSRRRLGAALELVEELEKRRTFTLGEVSEIHVDPRGALHLFAVQGGLPIRVGNDRFSRKLDRLERVYGELKPRLAALRGIDLNVPDQVIVKLHPQRVN